MLRLIGFLVKLALVATVVLVLGNVLEWRGKTISDQVKIQIAHAERSEFFNRVKTMSGNLALDPSRGAARENAVRKNSGVRRTEEDIPVSERQKLKALIRELNGSNSD